MSVWEILLLGVGLSMDACAVSISDGMCLRHFSFKNALGIAGMFGIWQAVMPVIGYAGCSLFYDRIKMFDHWIAFVLLCMLGGRMVVEGLSEMKKKRGNKAEREVCDIGGKLSFKLLMLQGLATSIDALAVGVSLAAVAANITESAFLIGLTTFLLCIPAVFLGRKSGDFMNDKAKISGGLILIAIGVKIFVQHMWFS